MRLHRFELWTPALLNSNLNLADQTCLSLSEQCSSQAELQPHQKNRIRDFIRFFTPLNPVQESKFLQKDYIC